MRARLGRGVTIVISGGNASAVNSASTPERAKSMFWTNRATPRRAAKLNPSPLAEFRMYSKLRRTASREGSRALPAAVGGEVVRHDQAGVLEGFHSARSTAAGDGRARGPLREAGERWLGAVAAPHRWVNNRRGVRRHAQRRKVRGAWRPGGGDRDRQRCGRRGGNGTRRRGRPARPGGSWQPRGRRPERLGGAATGCYVSSATPGYRRCEPERLGVRGCDPVNRDRPLWRLIRSAGQSSLHDPADVEQRGRAGWLAKPTAQHGDRARRWPRALRQSPTIQR